jgi:hypothetical protein
MVSYIRTQSGVHMVLNGKPVAVASTDKHYGEVLNALKGGASETDIQGIIEREAERVTQAVQVTPNIEVKGGMLYFKGQLVVDDTLTERMLRMLDEGFDVRPMAAFLENLMQNPSYRAVRHLYKFLEHGKCPITEDGHFLVYKAVREDYKDIHTGSFDNSIGKVVEVPRNHVDEDPEKTCSHGLHVCSYDYLPHFAHANGHVMVCKVNPRDVVAIPSDYNHTKMRVCRYEVVAEHEGYYQQEGDTLASTSVAVDQPPFVIEVDEGGGYEEVERYRLWSEAATRLKERFGANTDSSWRSARLVNSATGAVLQTVDNPHYEAKYEDDEYGGSDDGADEESAKPSYALELKTTSGDTEAFSEVFDTMEEALQEASKHLADDATACVHVVDNFTGSRVASVVKGNH